MNSVTEPTKRTKTPKTYRGFSLIITITMMVLLSLIAVGLLSLSSITLRSSQAGLGQTEARSNARMAAMMAIAQLQEMTGLDTRVTASAKLLDDNNIDVSGVWRSWEGTNHDSSGMPIAPDYETKNIAGDLTDPIADSGSGRFLGWLTSTSSGKEPNSSEIPESSTTQTGELIKIVSTGTVDTGEGIFLQPTTISSNDNIETGAFSWWTSGDNSKALVNVSLPDDADTASDWQQRLRGNRRPDPEVFGLSELDELTAEDAVIPSRNSFALIADSDSNGSHFYDTTTFSRGLLTNTATGGWRKDLSLLSEGYDDLPISRSANLPLFSAKPGESLLFNRTTAQSRPSNALLYHWADYLKSASNPNWQQTPPVCSWTSLVNYMKLYENLSSSSTRAVTMAPFSGSVGGDRYNFQEKIRIHPQVARIQWVFSLGSARVGRGYNPGIVVTPIITLWNPYNVALSVEGFSINFDEVFPLKLSFTVGRQTFNDRALSSIVNNRIRANFPDVELGPGENKIYSLRDSSSVPVNTGQQAFTLAEGYTPNGGALFTEINNGNVVTASAADNFAITNVEFSTTNLEGVGSDEGIGIRFQTSSRGAGNAQIIVMSYNTKELGGNRILNQLYPPIEEPLPVTISDVTSTNNVPFATATLGLRMVSPPPPDARFSNLLTKGMLQANPLQFYAEVGAANDANVITNLAQSGANHTINAPYDFVIQEASAWNDSAVTVDFDSRTSRGYIVSGNTIADGVNRCILAELPTRPLQSLADLQHFDVRNNNQMPPFQFNLIGNSSAHPIFGPEQLSITTSGDFAGLSNDDSYLLNSVLFDDWFISSIAPDLQDFSSSSKRSMEKVLVDHLEEEESLPNRFYLPSELAGREDPQTVAEKYLSAEQDSETDLFPFESVASLLEVDGMFNINSVSLDAWKAVLRQNREVDVPYFNSTGSVNTENSSDTAFPRSTIATDVNTTSGTVESRVSGYTALTDSQVDALAEEIVQQIRERGPFLSLSEFVNRQLTSNTDRALAGTIQRALDMLAESSDPSRSPFVDLVRNGQNITSAPPGQTDYKFPEAALGSTNFGVPGWLRQADILRPLAPIMSARDDTFTIRAYGDARSPSGTIIAQAWCEVIVQRKADYLDDADDATLSPHSDSITSEANRRFGRRYQMLSFRWLNEDEV